MTVSISREPQLAENIVMVGGLEGCGKTLLSPIISAMDRVELPTFSYEIEHYCELNYLNELSLNTASALIRMQTDLKLYNVMMGREVNFRPTDLSSVLKYHNPTQYFERLFRPGDEAIPKIIAQSKPILNLTIHNILYISDPIWNGLGDRCVYIEVVRHPLYMVRQQELNMNKLVNDVRDFIIYYEYKDKKYPWWTHGWENEFEGSSGIEQSVLYINQMTQRTEQAKEKLRDKYQANILTIPFEMLALDPEPWIATIASALGTDITDKTRNVMFAQKVPRKKIGQGLDLDIYRRCGWVPPKDGTTEREELIIRREDVVMDSRESIVSIIDQLSKSYEEKYWNPNS
jgi:hypothetical protein